MFRFSARLAAVVAALALPLFSIASASAQTITDIVLFRQNASGDTINEGWNTRGGDFVSNLYLQSGSTFLNSGNGAAARISLDLTAPGTYTYSFFGENVNDNTGLSLGINFFTNNSTSPAISARGANGGGFTASNRVTNDVFFNAVTGANTLSFGANGQTVTLSAFTFDTTSDADTVSSFNNAPNGLDDTVGSFTLTVGAVSVPEAGTLTLLGFALAPVALIVARRRR